MNHLTKLTAHIVLFAGLALGFSAALASCAGWQPQFHAIEPERVTDPKYGECARTGVTLQAQRTQFAMLTAVCVQRMGDAGVVIDPPEEIVVKDAGVESAQEVDAQAVEQ